MALREIIPLGIIFLLFLMGYIETRTFRRQFGVDVVQSERAVALPAPPDPPCRHQPVDSSRVSVGTSTLDERKARMLAWEEIKRIEREHGLVNGNLK